MSDSPAPRIGRLILIRHGESEGNRDRTFTQHADVSLTALGREQAQRAAACITARFQPVRLVSSPYARARDTAAIIATALRLPVDLEPALREQSFGVFAGQPYTALLSDAAYHDGPRWYWRPQGGESLIDVSARVVPAVERIARESAGRDCIVVSHGGVMLALCAHVTGRWDALSVAPNGGIVVIAHRSGQPLSTASLETVSLSESNGEPGTGN
jgi:broad specificity phosphatase PhoE